MPLKWDPSSDDTRADMDQMPASLDSGSQDLPEEAATPGITEGKLVFRPAISQLTMKGETETEPELAELSTTEESALMGKPRSDSTYSQDFDTPTPKSPVSSAGRNGYMRKSRAISMHDLTHRFFRKPVVSLWRLDVFRSVCYG